MTVPKPLFFKSIVPSRLRRSSVIDLIKFLIVLAVVTWLIARGTQKLGYHWQWYRVPQYLLSFEEGRLVVGPLLEGLIVTLRITFISLVLTVFFGLTSALFRLSHSIVARAIARFYLETIRNTPLLVQLFFIYFVLAPILDLSRFWSAVLALSLFEGAYASEIFRSGILSVAKGQWEAAFSLGLSIVDTYRHIVLPQAIRRMLPALTGQCIALVKDSALVSTIAIYDLTMQGQAIIAETYLTFEIWFTIATIYLIITMTLSLCVNILENRNAAES
jgi:polar amino acid transport system permease protein